MKHKPTRETHGMTGTPEYRTYLSMIRRCHVENDDGFPLYGARGIRVCDPWRNSFVAFLRDMGRRPPGTTIERLNNNGNYEPGNCVWATQKQQANNTRRNRYIECGGRRQSVAQWSDETGIAWGTIGERIRAGWPTTEALTITPNATNSITRGIPINFNGESKPLFAWGRELGIPWNCLWRRIHRYGWSIEKALTTPVDKTKHINSYRAAHGEPIRTALRA